MLHTRLGHGVGHDAGHLHGGHCCGAWTVWSQGGVSEGLDPGQSWASYNALIQIHRGPWPSHRMQAQPHRTISLLLLKFFIWGIIESWDKAHQLFGGIEFRYSSQDATLLIVHRRTRDAPLLHNEYTFFTNQESLRPWEDNHNHIIIITLILGHRLRLDLYWVPNVDDYIYFLSRQWANR